MPRTNCGDRRRDAEVAAILAAREEFESGFRRSQSGNLWRYDEDGAGRLTVFRRWGRWRWLITDGDENEWSPEDYETEGDALGALFSRVMGI